MTIIGPDGKPLYIDGVAQFAEQTCGECAYCIDRNDASGTCRPKLPPHVVAFVGPMFVSLQRGADECECFERMDPKTETTRR